ncbi:hypothetical protein KQX54_015163 [Cotesia glomerata]|uniref:Uncharacterized protein n=1 Tax=Cotesia glomerata TaxID=32391 RepID=A0AAV7HRI1_COTGL|nr:hypothetical protein KQX54_015163 [Cotesia glomerata]
MKIIDSINSKYQDVNSTPRVEVLLAGVILIAKRNVYSPPYTFRINVQRSEYGPWSCNDEGGCSRNGFTRLLWVSYTSAERELKRLNDWWKTNEEQFEDLNYDVFLYSFPWYLSGEGKAGEERRPVWSLSSETVCSSKLGAVVSNLFEDDHYAYPIKLSYLLEVAHDQDRKDSHWYTLEIDYIWNKVTEWRNRTARIVEKNPRLNKYFCLQKLADKEDEYDDE